MEVRLTIVGGKANRKVVTLQLPAIIGRSREANLTIAHPMVSRRHCELFEMQGLVRIRDLGSLNGTLVGGKEITEAPLRPNDEFSIGPLTFRVEYDYGGDVTVVAPVVPEERPEPVPVPPVPPPIGGDLPPFFRLSAAQAPQAPPASRDEPAEEAAGQWSEKAGAAGTENVPSAEPFQAPAAPAYPTAVGDESSEGEPQSPPDAGDKPVGPPSLFADLIPTIGPSSAEGAREPPSAVENSSAGTSGSQTVEPLDFFRYSDQPAADDASAVASSSAPAPFVEAGQATRGDLDGSAGFGEATPRAAVTAGPPPVRPEASATGAGDAVPPPVPVFEPATAEPFAGLEAPWLEESPRSGSPAQGEAEAQAGPPVPVPSAAASEVGSVSKKPKKGWRWWPFGNRKREEPATSGGSKQAPSPPGQPGPESSVTSGTSAPGAKGAAAGASAPGEPSLAGPASSSAPPSTSSPPRQSEEELDPEFEAFLRDLQ